VMVDLGTLEIGLRLDKANVERDIKDIRKELEALYELTEANDIAIKPKVDHKPLDELNKHLDKKVKHLRQVRNYFQANPIEVQFGESDEGEKKKGGRKRKNPVAQANSEGDNNWESKLGNVFQQVIDKSIENGVKSLLDGLPGPIRSIVANPLVGFIQGAMFSTADRTIQVMLNAIKHETKRKKDETAWQDRNVLTGEPLSGPRRQSATYHNQASQSGNNTVSDPWDDNDPLPTVQVVEGDSSKEKKQRTVVVEEVKDDKAKPQVMSGYSVKGDGTIANVSTQNTFNTLANEVKKLNGKIVPSPVQSLTQGLSLQGNDVQGLTGAIVALQASIDTLNGNFARFGGGEVTGGLAVRSDDVSIVSIDDLIDTSPIQMTAEVVGNVTGSLQRFGRGVQSVGTFVGNAVSPLYRMASAAENIVSYTIPYFSTIKGALQGAGTLALGAGAMHLLPGGVGGGLVHMAQSGLSPLTGMGASAVSGMIADLVTGLPFGMGGAISANVAGLLAGGAEVAANVGGAGLASLLMGKTIQNVASLPFRNVDKEKFQPNPIMITPVYEPVELLTGEPQNTNALQGSSGNQGLLPWQNKSKKKEKGNNLGGSTWNQQSLPASGSQSQDTLNVKQINAGEVKGQQLALPSKSGGVNYDVHGLDKVKSELDLVDYLSVDNKIKNSQNKNIQLFERDGLRRLAGDLGNANWAKLNRQDAVDYITKQDLSQVMGLLGQNPSRYYNPKAIVPTEVVNPCDEKRKEPELHKL